jgi:hypothetical protein
MIRRIPKPRYGLSGLGIDPVDYVYNGAVVIYSATVDSPNVARDSQGNLYNPCQSYFLGTCPEEQVWWAKHSQVWALAANQGTILQHSENALAGSISFKIRSDIDRASINDIKGMLDSYVTGAGFKLLASQIYFVSNPRRDNTAQPPVNTPGADPRYTQKPDQSIVDTFHTADNFLSNAFKGWGSAIDDLGKQLSSSLGFNIDGTTLMVAGGAIVLLLIAKGR